MLKDKYFVLSIGGTDPISGAGVQADLKTFSALKVYGTTVITSLVSQNTCGVKDIHYLDSRLVISQMDSVFEDIDVKSIKIGMLGKRSIIKSVSSRLKQYPFSFLVLDTIIFAKSGDPLLEKDAISCLIEEIFPIASIVTPNVLEAAALLGCKPAENEEQILEQGRSILNFGCGKVMIKGGHLTGENCPDWIICKEYEKRIDGNRILTRNSHGTGCALSSALAAIRPRCKNWLQAAKIAKRWIHQALLHSNQLHVGKGFGPVHHFYDFW